MPKPRNPIEELDPDLIKEAILKKEVQFLTPTQRELFDKVIVANDLLKKYRRRSAAIKFMCAEYPDYSSKQIGRYIDMALRIFGHEYKVDWDFMTVMAYDSIMQNIDDIREQIQTENEILDDYRNMPNDSHSNAAPRRKSKKDPYEEVDDIFNPNPPPTPKAESIFAPSGPNPALYQAIAREHANLLKFIGMRPKEVIDESIFEKQTYTISISINGKTVDLDLSQYNRLDQQQRQNLSDAMIDAGDMTDTEALELFET